MRHMQPRPGQLRKLHVARHANRLRCRRHPAQSESRRSHSFAHHRSSGQRNIFRMLDHREIQRPAIIHHLPRQLRRRNRFPIIRDCHDPRFFHPRDFCDRLALAPRRRRANWPHSNAPARFRAVQDESRHRSIVVHRLRVRHAANRGESAARRRPRSRLYGFRGFLPRLAQMHVKVNKSGRDDQPASIQDFRTLRCRNFPGRCDLFDLLPVQQHVEARVRL